MPNEHYLYREGAVRVRITLETKDGEIVSTIASDFQNPVVARAQYEICVRNLKDNTAFKGGNEVK